MKSSWKSEEDDSFTEEWRTKIAEEDQHLRRLKNGGYAATRRGATFTRIEELKTSRRREEARLTQPLRTSKDEDKLPRYLKNEDFTATRRGLTSRGLKNEDSTATRRDSTSTGTEKWRLSRVQKINFHGDRRRKENAFRPKLKT